jgi:hypothetical protein
MVGFTLFQKKLDRLKNYIKISFIEMILIFIFLLYYYFTLVTSIKNLKCIYFWGIFCGYDLKKK